MLEAQYADGSSIAVPNIELLLSRIRTIREVVGTGKIAGLSAGDLEKLDESVCKKIEEVVTPSLPVGPSSSYSKFARWICEIGRRNPVEIFTTNYDLLLEQAMERQHAPLFDGFVGADRPFFDVTAMEMDKLPERWTRVWKLHGSINWRLTSESSIVRSREGSAKPLIFPSHLKYAESRRLPYLAMRDRLRSYIKSRAVFVTCGYSFADEHLNEDIGFALAANPSSVCFALLYGPLAPYLHAKVLALKHQNLNLIAKDGAWLRGKEVKWTGGAEVDLGDFAAFTTFLTDEVMGE